MGMRLGFLRLRLLGIVLATLAIGALPLSARTGVSTSGRVAVVAPAAHYGALLTPSTVEEQTALAGLIVVGRVHRVTSRPEAGSIVTDVTLTIEQSLKGKAGPLLTVTLPGGQVGSRRLFVGGVPNFLVGERTLLFLKSSANPRLVRLWQSKYALAGSEVIQLESNTWLPIATVERRVANVLGREVNIGAGDEEVVSIGFTTFCPPWSVADMPVPYEVNPANPGSGGPSGSDFLRLVYNSWHNWQALPDSYPAFTLTGMTSNDGSDHFDRRNTIAWADLDSVGVGVLGVNYCAIQAGVRIDSDTLIDNTGRIWDSDDSDGITSGQLSLQSVMEHELGHGLGLGHSDAPCDGGPSTPLLCPVMLSGVRKAIQPDDQAGAAFLYPLSGSPPGAPSGLMVTPGASSNSLIWAGSSGSPIAYDIERSANGCSGSFQSIQTVAASTSTYVDDDYGNGLGAGDYCYRVKALGVGGDSPYSNAAQATAQADDSDGDGCADGEELGADETLGGQRDPANPYDFFDTPLPPGDPGTGTKSRTVSISDITGVIAKFGTADGGPPNEQGQFYNPDFDRTLLGPDPWDLGPPDGSVGIQDIVLVIAQFGHTCAGPP